MKEVGGCIVANIAPKKIWNFQLPTRAILPAADLFSRNERTKASQKTRKENKIQIENEIKDEVERKEQV